MRSRKIHIMVLDSDDNLTTKLVENIESTDDLKERFLVFCCKDIATANQIIYKHRIDIFIVDADVEKSNKYLDGLEFVEYIRQNPRYKYSPVIITTYVTDPGLYSVNNLHCWEYLEKPYDMNKLMEILFELVDYPLFRDDNRNIFFKKQGVQYSVNVSKVILIKSENLKVTIYSTDNILELPYISIDRILEKLDSDNFIKCSRNVVVNKNYIDAMDYTNRYIYMYFFEDIIDIGISYIAEIKKQLMD